MWCYDLPDGSDESQNGESDKLYELMQQELRCNFSCPVEIASIVTHYFLWIDNAARLNQVVFFRRLARPWRVIPSIDAARV